MRKYDSRHPFRWYLLLWTSLVYLWGFFEIWTREVFVQWASCQANAKAPEICGQIKEQLNRSGNLQPATLPFSLQWELLQMPLILFTLFMLLFMLLSWLSLSDKHTQHLFRIALPLQSVLVMTVGFVVSTASVIVPLSLTLAIILEVCILLKQIRPILLVSSAVMVLLLLTILLNWRQWNVLEDNNFNIIMALTLFAVSTLFVTGFFMLYRQQIQAHTELEAMYTQLTEAHSQLQISALRIEELTRMTERQRLARELHDTLAQGLAGIILQLGVVNVHMKSYPAAPVQVIVEQMLSSARVTLANARRSIDDLRTSSLANCLTLVEEELRRFSLLTPIPCQANLSYLTLVPPEQVEQVVRIISEGLSNIARHSQAQQAWLRSSIEQDTLMIEIGDNGIGFDLAQALHHPGRFGLLGLRERANLIGSQITIWSKPGEGSRIVLSLPLSSSCVPLQKQEIV